MRLAVFTSRYPAQVATFFERDMRALADAGVEVDVFSVAPLDERLWKHSLALLGPEHLPRERVHHLRLRDTAGAVAALRSPLARADARAILSSARHHGLTALAKTAYVLPKAWTWARQYLSDRLPRYDHVLAYWGNYAGTCAYAFHRLATPDIPFSIWLHAGTDLYFRRVFMREKLSYADRIITCCEFNVEYITREFPDLAAQLRPRIHVSHHGLDLKNFPFDPGAAARPAGRIIAVGRFAHDKGYDDLLRAAALAARQGAPLTVDLVGQGPELRTLESLVAELGLHERVRFRGWLPFSEVRQAMSEATILVHPSTGLGDGLPNVLREAMAVGTPVIASRVAGIPDALRDGCGVLVPPRNVEALAAAIAALLSDEERRRAIALRARARVEERYDLQRNGTRLAELLGATRRPSAPLAVALPAGSEAARQGRSYDLLALELLVRPRQATRHDPDAIDWAQLRQAAQRGGAIVRLADALHRPDEPLPSRFMQAAAGACRRAQQIVEAVDRLSAACTQHGIPHAFLRTAECYPDPPNLVELLVGEPGARVDAAITANLHATRQHGLLHHRLAGATTYRLAHGHRLLIRHARLGRLGEHARFARLLLAQARPHPMGTITPAPRAPAPADHLLLVAMHQLYTRPAFRLSELGTAIAAIQDPALDWDCLFASAISTAMLPALSCYLRYVDGIVAAIGGSGIVPEPMRRRFAGAATLPLATGPRLPHFPDLRAARALYWQHLRGTLESGRWHSAARLCLLPVLAALSARGRKVRTA